MKPDNCFGTGARLSGFKNWKYSLGDYVIYEMYRPGQGGMVKGLVVRCHVDMPRAARAYQLRRARKQLRAMGDSVVT